MRFISTLLLITSLSPALLSAQLQAPSAGELKMTSDPKAPGAAAVYLNLEETTNDPQHFYTFYARIKVLREAGEKLATVEIPPRVGDATATGVKPKYIGQDWTSTYRPDEKSKAAGAAAPQAIFRITGIQARTIHPDGTIVPLAIRPEDLARLNDAAAHHQPMTFILPGAEVGSILEYRYSIGYSDTHFSSPFWQIQQPYFIHKAHFAFTPFNDFLTGAQSMTSHYMVDASGKVVNTLIGWPVLPPGVSVKAEASGEFTLDMTDIPPLPREEWMPPAGNYAYQVRFYYKNASSESDFWASEEKRWSKDVDRFTASTPALVQAVFGLVAPGDSHLDKAKKLYQAVQTLDNTDFALPAATAGQEPHPATNAGEVWERKRGTGHEIALLYLALLRVAGLTAYDMEVVNRDKGVFSSGYLSPDQFDDDVVILDLDGKETFLDPAEKMCPFGYVHWKHAGASGIRQTASGVAVASTPLLPYKENAVLRAGDLTLDSYGNVTGFVRFIMTGQDALHWRQQVLMHGADQAKQAFDAWLQSIVPQGVQAHLDRFVAADNPDLNLIAMAEVQGSLGAPASGGYTIPAFFLDSRTRQPFVDEPQRIEPIDMHYGEQVTDQLVYHLPSGFTVENAPAACKITLQPYAAFATDAQSGSGQIAITRVLVRAFTLAGTPEYEKLRNFYQKVDASDHAQLVLHGAAPQGN